MNIQVACERVSNNKLAIGKQAKEKIKLSYGGTNKCATFG